MTFLETVGIIAAIGTLGSLLASWKGRGNRVPGATPAQAPPEGPTPRNPAPLQGLSSGQPVESLRKIRNRMASGSIVVPVDMNTSVVNSLDGLIEALTAAYAAIRPGGPDDISVAAKKLVQCHLITGLGWRKYMAVSMISYDVRKQVDAAFAEDARPLMDELARLLAARLTLTLVHGGEAYALTCAACGADAVTFQVKESCVQSDTMSAVSLFRKWEGKTAQRLAELLVEGSARAVVDYFASLDRRPGCDVYCPDCDRVYCRDHFSVESEWSGSWHTATYATCPLKHEREIE